MPKTMITISKPTPKQVEIYLKKWKKLKNYPEQESCIQKLFRKTHPKNNDLDDILAKIGVLDSFYSTTLKRYGTVVGLAKHILTLNFDSRIKAGDLSLIENFCNCKEMNRNPYSFATKYCHHHNPDQFPVYDKFVAKILWHFHKQDSFFNSDGGKSKLKKDDLKNYSTFFDVMTQFREYYGLTDYNFWQLDKYLWLLGKDSFQ